MIVNLFVVVATPMLPVMGFFVVYFWAALNMSSIAITIFGGRLIGGSCVTGPIPVLIFPYPVVCSDVGGGSSEMSSNI